MFLLIVLVVLLLTNALSLRGVAASGEAEQEEEGQLQLLQRERRQLGGHGGFVGPGFGGGAFRGDSFKCFELRYKWELTGLPRDWLADAAFTPDCLTTGSETPVVDCTSYCYTMLVEDPDEKKAMENQRRFTAGAEHPGDLRVLKPYVVRGCYGQMIPYVSALALRPGFATPNQPFCEWDQALERYTSKGELVKIQMLVEFCVGTSMRATATDPFQKCNSGDQRKDFESVLQQRPCTGQTYNNTMPSGMNLQCYNCDSTNTNCYQNVCTKKYCVRATTFVGDDEDHYHTRKFCSDVNPFGINEYCFNNRFDAIVAGNNRIRVRSAVCYCKDRLFCNGAVSVKIGTTAASIAALMAMIFVTTHGPKYF